VVARALGAGHHVAFYHLDGPLKENDATKRALRSAAESVPGVDKGSVRVALDTLTIAFAFDPGRKAVILCGGDKSGGSQRRFYRQLIEKADRRFDGHLAALKAEPVKGQPKKKGRRS
jgi:hypothetical protein